MKHKAFTLIELLVVISIIALLASVVVASLNTARDKGRLGAAKESSAIIDHVAGEQSIGIWEFDECTGTVARDRSGFGDDGALTNMATSSFSGDTPIAGGCSLLFNGSNQYVSTPINIDSYPVLTIAAWVKKTSAGSGNNLVFGNDNGGYDRGLSAEGSGVWSVWAGNTQWTPAGANIQMNNWQFVAVVYEAADTKLYVDGVQYRRGSASLGYAGSSTFKIGRSDYAGGSAYFPGYIDSVRMYAKDLTASEIGAMYLAEKDRYVAMQK